ncbi:MAG: PIG-L deacetylase family protein [Nocardioidaceae bacterium]
MTEPLPDKDVERVLTITAHPDDVDFGVAGTVARWSAAGIAVTYCICTDGQAGGFEDARDRTEIPAIRRREQTAAAALVGVHDLRFLGYGDGELAVTDDLVRDLVEVIRDVRPQRVVAQSPERVWDFIGRSHPDHLASGEAAVRAVYPFARNPYAFPELRERGLEAWTVSELWLTAHPSTNHAVDVTEHMEAKIAAILAHESQHPAPDQINRRMRMALRHNASEYGLAESQLAEAFFVVHTV